MNKIEGMAWLMENITEWPNDIEKTCWGIDADFYWSINPLGVVVFAPDCRNDWRITKEEWEAECNPT